MKHGCYEHRCQMARFMSIGGCSANDLRYNISIAMQLELEGSLVMAAKATISAQMDVLDDTGGKGLLRKLAGSQWRRIPFRGLPVEVVDV